ncbi:MAG: head-tail connector protein [Xanthobacteraceae bacterium]|nr:head-tail connector protein [Xanthobacteraceae bacterium]
MASFLLASPATEPLSVADAKAFLRVEHDDDDAIIASLISSARNHVEALTRRGLITQTWRLVLDRWPDDGRIRPKLGPLQSVAAARVYDQTNAASEIDVARFVVDAASGTIAAPGVFLPLSGRALAGIELDVVIGFGAATDVPQVLLQAIRMVVAHWYENRGLVAIGQSVAMLPPSVNAMIGSYRVLSL